MLDLQEELANEAEAGVGARGGLVLVGPTLVPQELHFLVVYVFSAQDLLSFSSISTPAINALVQVCIKPGESIKRPWDTGSRTLPCLHFLQLCIFYQG